MNRISAALGFILVFLLMASLWGSVLAESEPVLVPGSFSDFLSFSGIFLKSSAQFLEIYAPQTEALLAEVHSLYNASSKVILVSLSLQTLYLIEDSKIVAKFPTLTGQTGMETPPGRYQVLEKYRSVTMEGERGTPREYRVENVPWVLFFIGRIYAIHGNYWKPLEYFGKDPSWTGSHGCVGLTPESAKIVYDWATVGIEIIITE